MIARRADRPTAITLGVDKALQRRRLRQRAALDGCDDAAQNTSGRNPAIDGRTTGHGSYAVSPHIRKRIEQAFDWIKTVAGQESAAGTSSRWRSQRLPRSCRRGASHLPGQVRWRNPFWGSQGLPGPALQIGLRRVLIVLRARSAGSFSARPARPLQNCRIGGMRPCHELEPRNTRTLVSSPSGTCRAIAMSVWRTSTI